AEGPEAETPVAEAQPAETQAAAEPEPRPARADGAGLKASPLAKRLAAELGVDLAGVKGSGPDGRIVKEDVEALAKGKRGVRAAPAVPARRADGPDTQVIEPTRMQATIARRMLESKTTVPEFTVTV